MKKLSRAIVTGGAGFIGSHIVDELLALGVETTVVDDLSTGSRDNLSRHADNPLLKLVVGDISEMSTLLPDEKNVDAVFHEAAIASVPRSVTDPMTVHDVNVTSSLEVMNFCVERRVRRFIFASSAAVYGAMGERVASEEMLCSPSSPYGASKLAVEGYMSSYNTTYGVETVALRYFNVYGPRQKMNDYSGVITVFANTLLAHKNPVIYGDGLQTRDFVYVKDIARANILAAQAECANGRVFNVASGCSTTVLQLAECMKDIANAPTALPTFAPPRRGDVRSGAASIAMIRDALGFAPSVALKDGLKELVHQFAAEPAQLA